jgi:hypothetical protein
VSTAATTTTTTTTTWISSTRTNKPETGNFFQTENAKVTVQQQHQPFLQGEKD